MLRIFAVAAAGLLSVATPALAQSVPDPAAASAPASTAPAPQQSFRDMFFDKDDGKFDVSALLQRGGFMPMPVIITEPAVDGGLGLMAQFVTFPSGDPQAARRRTLGGAYTGNDSYGYGYFQSGRAFDKRLSYKAGIGRGQLTIATYPGDGDIPLEYTTSYKYGLFGSALWHLQDDRFSVGPILDFRRLDASIDVPGIPPGFEGDLSRTLQTGALGLGFHFDSRDNPVTPTRGLNAYVNAKFNSSAFGSDRNFDLYDLEGFYFHPLSADWRVGFMASINAASGDFPFYFAPSVTLRGVEADRYQGQWALSSELEVTRRLGDRWSVLVFAGYGQTRADNSRLFSDSGSIPAGGAGFRYRVARKLGIDAGIDVARSPDKTIFYIQFGHAWSRGMD